MSNIIKSTKNQNIILYEFKETFYDAENREDAKGNEDIKRSEEGRPFVEDETKRAEMLKEMRQSEQKC